MGEFLLQFIGFMLAWVPRLIVVNSTHAGVKFKCGKTPIAMSPGLHWYWPVVTEWVQYPIVRHTHDFECQSLTTTDGVDIIISVAVVCEIHDILAALAENHEINDTVGDVTRGVIAEIILSHSFKDITTNFHGILKSMESEIGESLNVYGVTVLAVKIMELSKARTIRLAGSSETLLRTT